MTYFRREIESTLLRYIKTSSPPHNVVLLGGARQTGKSTLLIHLFPPKQHVHINLARDGALADAIDATNSFDDFTFLIESRLQYRIGSGKIMVIDEAQLSKKLGGYVRFMKETWQRQQVILTGSTLSGLFDDHPNPTGRVVEFVLRPFNFIEFLRALENHVLVERLLSWDPKQPLSETVHHEAVNLLKEYLTVGGLPEAILAYKNKQDYLQILANIFAFYKRDFTNQTDKKLTNIFSQCFLKIASSVGSPIKNSTIIKSSSPGYKKVADVLSLLERWHQILKVECETSRLSKVGTITPKRYIFDHGIRFLQNPARFAILDLFDNQDIKRNELGGTLENLVLTEFLSTNPAIAPRSWAKTNQSGLVDFIFCQNKKVCAVEVKSALSLNEKHLIPLRAYHAEYPKSQLALANLDRGGYYNRGHGGPAVINIPLYAIYPFFRTILPAD